MTPVDHNQSLSARPSTNAPERLATLWYVLTLPGHFRRMRRSSMTGFAQGSVRLPQGDDGYARVAAVDVRLVRGRVAEVLGMSFSRRRFSNTEPQLLEIEDWEPSELDVRSVYAQLNERAIS